jgi:photosystem II stability/assembly factor-like uncharacterized protein
MKLIAPGVGWAMANGSRLLWTENGGTDWKDITPANKNEGIKDIFFLDTHRGWALLAGHKSVPRKPDGEAQFDLESTTDAGATWETNHVTIPPQVMENPDRLFPDLTGQGSIVFADTVHGWMNLAGEGNGGGGQGRLLVTSDGGRTWNQAPGDREEWGSIVLITPEEGWMVGGGGSNELYVSRNGAKRFERVRLATPAEISPADSAAFGLPTFENSVHGFLPVTYSGGERVKSATVLFVTDDGGRTWKPDRILKNLEDAAGAGAMPSAVVNSSWITVAVSKHRPSLTRLDAGARHDASIDSASGRSGYFQVFHISFVAPTKGWVVVGDGELLSTSDGGAAWTDITPGPR